MEFEGKVVLITGAGSGIGAATARTFAKKGATLSLIDLNGEWMKRTEQEILGITSDPKKLLVSVGNLIDASVREKYVNDSVNKFGRIDVLFNIAGVFIGDSVFDFDLKKFQRTLDVNLVAPFHLSGLSAPHLVKTKGCILNIASTVSDLGYPNMIAYDASKAAVASITKSLAVAFGPHQVRVNSIRPGVIATNIFSSETGAEYPRSSVERMAPHHALGRIGEPSEIAEMLAIMASDKCAFMTGTNLLFDGGFNVLRPDIASDLLGGK